MTQRVNIGRVRARAEANRRLKAACVQVAGVLDTRERDVTWSESQELENAAIAYGRLLIKIRR